MLFNMAPLMAVDTYSNPEVHHSSELEIVTVLITGRIPVVRT